MYGCCGASAVGCNEGCYGRTGGVGGGKGRGGEQGHDDGTRTDLERRAPPGRPTWPGAWLGICLAIGSTRVWFEANWFGRKQGRCVSCADERATARCEILGGSFHLARAAASTYILPSALSRRPTPTSFDMAAKRGGSKSPQTADAPTDGLVKWMKRLVFFAFFYSVCKILDRVKVRHPSPPCLSSYLTQVRRTGGTSSLPSTCTPLREQR